MKPWKIVFTCVLAIFLVVIIAIATLAIFIFVIPYHNAKKEYGEDKYCITEYIENDNNDYVLYNGNKYIDHETNDRIQLTIDYDVDLNVISWSNGFPFVSIMTYSSYDDKNPDYIVADWIGSGYIYTNEKFNIKNENMKSDSFDKTYKITDMISGKYLDLQLYNQKSICEIEFHSQVHSELSVYAKVYLYNNEYYISFDGGLYHYKLNDYFITILQNQSLI